MIKEYTLSETGIKCHERDESFFHFFIYVFFGVIVFTLFSFYITGFNWFSCISNFILIGIFFRSFILNGAYYLFKRNIILISSIIIKNDVTIFKIQKFAFHNAKEIETKIDLIKIVRANEKYFEIYDFSNIYVNNEKLIFVTNFIKNSNEFLMLIEKHNHSE